MKVILLSHKKKAILLLFLLGLISDVSAQEYKYEIGGGIGTSMYMGDANKNAFFSGWHPAAGVVYRKNNNFRWAMKGNLLLGKISGDTKNMDNVYPDNASASFDRIFCELGGQMEFNFLPYSDKYAYLQTSRITPYLFAGFGVTYASGNDSFFGLNLPVGVGVKYKVRNRVNLGMEYSFRRLFSDGLDAPDKSGFHLDNPYKINGGMLKNKDWYSLIQFSITWDFGPNDRPCTNE